MFLARKRQEHRVDGGVCVVVEPAGEAGVDQFGLFSGADLRADFVFRDHELEDIAEIHRSADDGADGLAEDGGAAEAGDEAVWDGLGSSSVYSKNSTGWRRPSEKMAAINSVKASGARVWRSRGMASGSI